MGARGEPGSGGPEWAPPKSSAPRARTLVAKRVVDVTVGSLLLVATAPLVIVLALVLVVQGRTWPFFAHYRVGAGGRMLWIPKLRTLPRATPAYVDKSPAAVQPISRLADVMRRTHLDELPQLVLVPIGRLSLVGPRPMMAHELDGADEHWRSARSGIRPGCTGLWQVGAGQGLRVRDSPEYDLAYVRNVSLRLDTWILWRTVRQAVGDGHGLALAEMPPWLLPADREVAAAARRDDGWLGATDERDLESPVADAV